MALPPGGALSFSTDRSAEVWMSMRGDAALEFQGGSALLRPAAPLLVPHGLGAFEIRSSGGADLARVSVP
jgi:hypothetical protein